VFAVAGTEDSQVVLSHARSLSTPAAVAVLHNLHCLGRRSEERYKGEGFSSQLSAEEALRARRRAQDGSFHDARQTTSALPGTLWLCWHTLASFELFMQLAPPSSQWRPRTALEGLATANDPRDPSLANPGSHTTLHRTARHARSARGPGEGEP